MKSIGQFLKTAREQQGLSLKDIAERTKIHIQKLSAIEEGQKDLLPAQVFCIGLIKSYARELKVDTAEIDRLCQEAFLEEGHVSLENVKPTPEEDIPAETQPVGRFQIPKIAGIIISLAVSVVLIFVIYQVVEKMNSYSQEEELAQEVFIQDNNQPELDSEANSEVEKTDNELVTTPEPQLDLLVKLKPEKRKIFQANEDSPQKPSKDTPKDSTKEIYKDTAKDSAKESQASINDETIKATPTKSNANEADDDFSDDNFNAPPPKSTENQAVVVSDNKLTLTALEPVRAEVVWADGFVQVMLLKSQESKTLVFSQPITLRINNGGAVQVSFNESEKRVPGSFNQPIEIRYP